MTKSIALLALALLAGAFAGPVQASSQLSVQAAGSQASSSPITASATVNFRIVIRESLVLGGPQQKARVASPQLTEYTSIENGRQVVTLARP